MSHYFCLLALPFGHAYFTGLSSICKFGLVLQAIRVFFQVRQLSMSLLQETETQLPLTKLQDCVTIDNILDLSKSFHCLMCFMSPSTTSSISVSPSIVSCALCHHRQHLDLSESFHCLMCFMAYVTIDNMLDLSESCHCLMCFMWPATTSSISVSPAIVLWPTIAV